jgi:hypothetical protein
MASSVLQCFDLKRAGLKVPLIRILVRDYRSTREFSQKYSSCLSSIEPTWRFRPCSISSNNFSVMLDSGELSMFDRAYTGHVSDWPMCNEKTGFYSPDT